MNIPIPQPIAKDLANRATILARARAPRSKEIKEHGADSLYPIAHDGKISIGVPSKFSYMKYQDKGTKPHVQTELAGKVIPMRGPNGKINFRRVNASKIGVPVMTRDPNGAYTGTKLAWTHPGLPAQHFIENSIREVVNEWKNTLTKEDVVKLLQESTMFQEIISGLRKAQ